MRLPTVLRTIVLALALACLGATSVTAAPAPGRVFTLDARPWRRFDARDARAVRAVWDRLHLLAALQGLANREEPRLYLFYCSEWGIDTDAFWLEDFRRPGGWLETTEIRALPDLDAALREFAGVFAGLVAYDERVPATSNLASTAAGVERLLPVRFDPEPGSLYHHLTHDLGLEVKLWLVRADGTSLFTGPSPKTAAYRWALDRWLDPRRPGAGPVGGYYLDAAWLRLAGNAGPDLHTLSNHDWFIARRGFFFDLSPWADEAPVDEPDQPMGADRAVLLDILRRLYDRAGGGIVKLGGFPPWPYKYTTHAGAGRHQPVPTEWEFTRLISQYNAYHEADAAGLGAMANASFCAHYPLRERYAQTHRPPSEATWRARGFLDAQGRVAPRYYVGHYVGDYDAPSWWAKSVPAFFRDPARGRVPLGWAVDPNLADRAPHAMDYAYRHATTNDVFIAGDSGAGYLNPRGLTVRPDSGLPSGLEAWTAYCTPYYERWGMTITGFLLDGASGASTEREFAAYRGFSPDGLGTHFERGPALRAGIPTCPERDLPDRAAEAAAVLGKWARERQAAGRAPGFFWARSILKSPSWYAEVSRRLSEEYGDVPLEVVDPYTFFGLIRRDQEQAVPGTGAQRR